MNTTATAAAVDDDVSTSNNYRHLIFVINKISVFLMLKNKFFFIQVYCLIVLKLFFLNLYNLYLIILKIAMKFPCEQILHSDPT